MTCARISSYRAAVCACIRRLRGVVPRGARSSSCPGYLWLSAFEHPLVLLNQFRTGRRGASCARPAVVVPPPLEVGPRVGPLPLVPVALCRSRRPLSLWRLRRRSFAGGFLLWCARALGRGVQFLRAVTLSTVSVSCHPSALPSFAPGIGWLAGVYQGAAHPYRIYGRLVAVD